MSRPVVRATPHVGGMYGAPMGRYGDKFDSTFAGEVKLARVPLWDGGYDHGGAPGSGTVTGRNRPPASLRKPASVWAS